MVQYSGNICNISRFVLVKIAVFFQLHGFSLEFSKLSCLDENFSEFEADQDRKLLSACCEKVVLPKVVNIVRSSYDPVSTMQTNKLVGCLSRLVADFPTLTPRSKQLRELLSVVVEMIKECLDNDVYIPMYTKHQMETPNTPHSLFFQRQFWAAFKLFKNILAWAVKILYFFCSC